jgi:hypothetical protein
MQHQKSGFRFFVYVVAAWLITHIFVLRFGLDGNARVLFRDFIQGQAHVPYAYRALVPALLGFISAITPDFIKEEAVSFGSHFLNLPFPIKSNHPYECLLFFGLCMGCYIGFLYALRDLIRLFYGEGQEPLPPVVAELAPLGALALLPVFFRYFNYLYDPATLFLFTTALRLLLRQQPRYYALFILACINKETAILLIPLFALWHFRRIPFVSLLLHLTAQTAIFLVIKFAINTRFAHNPGEPYENLFYIHTVALFTRLDFYYLLAFLTALLLFWYVAYESREHKPLFLRRALPLVFLPQFALGLVIGFVDELRGYYEAYPILFLLALPTLYKWSSAKPVIEQEPSDAR